MKFKSPEMENKIYSLNKVLFCLRSTKCKFFFGGLIFKKLVLPELNPYTLR